jgi:predicted oxidoreductase
VGNPCSARDAFGHHDDIENSPNASAQVISHRGTPIPGLYAAGNNAAHTEYGGGYQAGFSLGSGMTFGYLTARHMAGLN